MSTVDHPAARGRSSARGSRRGNYSLLFALTLVLVVGFGAMSVDVSLMTMSRLQAQAAADSASHAALVVYLQADDVTTGQSLGATAAEWVVDHSSVGMGVPTLAGVPEYGAWDFTAPVPAFGAVAPGDTPNAVRVVIERTGGNAVQLLLAPLLGVHEFEVQATSVAAQEMRALMVVQDMSCSMMYRGGSPVQDSHDAVEEFVEYLAVTRPQPGDQFGLAMFAGGATKQAGCDPCYTTSADDPPWLPLSVIETQFDLIDAGIDGICQTCAAPWQCNQWFWASTFTPSCGSTNGVDNPHPWATDIGECTNPAPGIRQATAQLTEVSDGYFRGIVLFSDGLPTCGEGQDGAYAAATTAWNNDVNIWSILFHNGSFDTTFMQNLVRGSGFFQSSPDSDQIDEMFQEVARSLPTTFVQ
ncbi:MAG: pilus assembly protein TadG-related protein [Myxococcota bacterium]